MWFKRPGIHPGNNIDTHSVRTVAAPCSLGLCLCLPPRPLSELQPNGFCYYSGVLSQGSVSSSSPSVSPFFLWRVKFLILKKSYKRPLDPHINPHIQLPWSLLLPRHNQARHFCSSAQCLLITEGFLDLAEKKDSILSLASSSVFKKLITYHRISPFCAIFMSPSKKANYFAMFFFSQKCPYPRLQNSA